MKTLIIGASGQVGRYLLKEFRSQMTVLGTYCSHKEKGLQYLDITDQTACDRLLRAERPTHILLPAAATNVDWCEENPDSCYQTNVKGVENISVVARDLGGCVVLFSTDHVFGESIHPYREEDPTCPLNVYARSKVQAEQVVQNCLPPHAYLIIRTGWVYGLEPQGKNFVTSLCRRISQGELVKVPEDQWGSPTYAYDLARVTLALVQQGKSGTYHVVGPEWMTRHHFAQAVCATFSVSEAAISPVNTTVLRQRASRPRKCRLATSKLQETLSLRLMAPNAGLRHMQQSQP